ncbi:Stp1/IreP family PP2C-type Ser/Thr phosphatase [Brevibacillus daliensis]|uniref:Stp1/IreP family PP2C-type Ser/Thr phosphatase n=1 Tax=Brevibacillus daliensis TaxID=2892995 RepID=UPI001E646B4C|nr:Stp1/IreP family PP2C-type Ser/Thr phosphatase [Brevibacillus daliensis]
MEIAMKSHVGCVRQVNEDFYACAVDLAGRVFAVVADGMGGHKAGDVASKMAVESILEEMKKLEDDMTEEDERELLMNALIKANREVFEYAESHPECSGMGTTVVATLVKEERGVTAHIGDSRIYLYKEDGLTQHTEDHTLVQELLKTGQINSFEASVHPQKNVIMRALGTEGNVRIDLGQYSWSEGDIVMLCSDGLSNKVPNEMIQKMLSQPGPLQESVDVMVQYALDSGGEDNITCVALRNKTKPLQVCEKEGGAECKVND